MCACDNKWKCRNSGVNRVDQRKMDSLREELREFGILVSSWIKWAGLAGEWMKTANKSR